MAVITRPLRSMRDSIGSHGLGFRVQGGVGCFGLTTVIPWTWGTLGHAGFFHHEEPMQPRVSGLRV